MEKIYFSSDIIEEKKWPRGGFFGRIKRKFLVDIVNSLNSDNEFKKVKSVEQSNIYIQNKIKGSLKELRSNCLAKKVELNLCKVDPKKWNSARLSEFRTYSESRSFFKSLFLKRNESLKSFFRVFKQRNETISKVR